MKRELKSVLDPAFSAYGQVLEGYDFVPLVEAMNASSPKPTEGTVYVPSCPALETLPLFAQLSGRYYGGMPIQIGYCNGVNNMLQCLEYHRDSEVDVAADTVILLLAQQNEIVDGKLDTALVQAFLLPAGTGVELFATTLHYAPCCAVKGDGPCNNAPDGTGFRVAIILPRGTNTDLPVFRGGNTEDMRLFARNKWLLAHPASPEAHDGAYIGLTGDNICTEEAFA